MSTPSMPQDPGIVSRVIDSTRKLVSEVRTPIQLAAITIIAVAGIGMAALYFGLEQQHRTLALAIVVVGVVVLGWVWSSALTRGVARADDEQAQSPLVIHEGQKTRVLKLRDSELHRSVIRKELSSSSDDDKNEFVEGARRATRLSDLPNFISIYGAKLNAKPPYILMQQLERNLDTHIDEAGDLLDLEEIRRIVSRIGMAVREAHERGVPLGNIKPSNILLDDRHEPHLSPRVRLTFVKRAGIKEAVRKRQITLEDLVYAAPELFGSRSTPRELSDQYSLGVLAYHLATSSLPETLETIAGKPESARLEKTCRLLEERGAGAYGQLPDLHELRAEIPRQVSDTFKRMVALAPEDRYDRLDLALGAMRTAEHSMLIAARDSYIRCLSNEARPTFIEQFYAEFVSNENVAKRFGSFDSEQWTKQHGKLEHAIDAAFDFAKDYVANVEFEEPNAMTSFAKRHREIGIGGDEYDWFVEALVRTVCGTPTRAPFDPDCADPRRRLEIERSWRELMRPVVRYFRPSPG